MESRSRLEALVAPLAVVLAVALVGAFVVLGGDDDPGPGAAPGVTDARPSATSAHPDAGRTQAAPRTREPGGRRTDARLPERLQPLATDLPEASCPAPEPPVPVVALTLNAAAPPRTRRYDLDRLLRELRVWDADVLLLQDVRRPRALAEGLGMAMARTSDGGRDAGAVVLSRYPITARGESPLPGAGAPGEVVGARLDVAGESVDVYSTRLADDSGAVRAQQADAVSDAVSAVDLPTLVGGDLGSGPDATPARTLTGPPADLDDAWAAVGVGGGETVPAARPRQRHDYLLGDASFAARSAELLRSEVASHLALRVSYDVTTVPACLPPGSVN